MAAKVIVILLLLAIVASLFSGLLFLTRDRGGGTRTLRALTWRVGLSLLLFAFLALAFHWGLLPGKG